MKLIIFSLFFSNLVNAQSKEFTDLIIRDLDLHLNNIPHTNYIDSCYYSSTLLKIQFNEQSKITSILFSDNAEEWLKNELDKAKIRIDIKKMESFAKKEDIKNSSFIFPYILRTVSLSCTGLFLPDLRTKQKYFSFNSKPLFGAIQFCKPLVYEFTKPVH